MVFMNSAVALQLTVLLYFTDKQTKVIIIAL